MRFAVLLVTALLAFACANEVMDDKKKHHRHHHHKHHGASPANQTAPEVPESKPVLKALPRQPTVAVATSSTKSTKSLVHTTAHTKAMTESDLLGKMKKLEEMLASKESAAKAKVQANMLKGQLEVNGPLPFDFSTLFPKGVAAATGCDIAAVKVLDATPVAEENGNVQMVTFEAPANVVQAVEAQAANPDSKLASGALHSLLVAKETVAHPAAGEANTATLSYSMDAAPAPASTSVDIDVEMPYGDLEPFGREDTAQELTEQSISESDGMVDQLEKAEVAEEKRAVFRALTRLRGAAITSFDGIARSQTGNIDEYNKINSWRKAHPLHHLADEESDVSKWAFPDNAD